MFEATIDLATAKSMLLPVHGFFGVCALLAGGVALWARKARGRHTRSGVTFVVLMASAIVVSVPVIVLSKNLFLGGLGSVAAYLLIMGLRLGRFGRPGVGPTRLDKAIAYSGIGSFSLVIAFGVWVVLSGKWLGIAAAGIGWLGFSSASSHLKFFATETTDPHAWMPHHGGTMGGAFIASATAFCAAVVTNALPVIPEFLVWLTPTAVLMPVVNRQVRRARS